MAINRQVRMYEIGISQMIAHNLARYETGQSTAYTVTDFIAECRLALKVLEVSDSQIESIMDHALELMHQDVATIRSSQLLNSNGGSECTPFALLCGPVTRLLETQSQIS